MKNEASTREGDVRSHVLEGTPSDIIERYESLNRLAQKLDFGDLDSNVVVVDTETTGLSFARDELTQIAAAKMSKGRIVDWYVTFVNPGKPIPEDIVHLTNITDELVQDAPTPEEALAQLAEFAGDALIVAHNAEFDRTFLTRHPAGYPLLENIWIDSLELSRIALPRLKSHRLADLVQTFGAPSSTHRADDDVAATCVVYRTLLAAVCCMPQALIAHIAHMADVDVWPTGHVFAYIAEHYDDLRAQAGGLSGPAEGEGSDLREEGNKRLFSLLGMRKRRIKSLPIRKMRFDAEAICEDGSTLEFPEAAEISDAFSEKGLMGRIYEAYEPRSEQTEMALAVQDAFRSSSNLEVEAGTGVGKSMAYLVPAALTAQANNITIGVATKTNALLDQLVYQELPALAEALEQQHPEAEPLEWAALKGMSHYLCLRKVNRIDENGPGMRDFGSQQKSQAPTLAAVLSFIEQTEFGDFDAAKADFRLIPRRAFATSSGECLRRKCPFYNGLCFVHAARRRAEAADIVVTNQALLFCNCAADGGLLPPIRHWIVDEAHGTEEEARNAFSQGVKCDDVLNLASRVSGRSSARNIFTRVEAAASGTADEQITLLYALLEKAHATGEAYALAADEFCRHVKDLLFFEPVDGSKGKGYEQITLWVNAGMRESEHFREVAEFAHAFIEASDKLITAGQELVAYLENIEGVANAQRDVAAAIYELKDARNAAELFFESSSDEYVYQAMLDKKKDRHDDVLEALMLDVGGQLEETLYSTTHSVVYTSATLAVNRTFANFESAVGLNASESSRAKQLILDSSYDFDNNMLVYVATDIPEPTKPGYMDSLAQLLIDAHVAQRGSMLTLFTNRKEMERCHAIVQPALQREGLRVICQKWGVSTKGLRDEFLADEHLSLFALKSFWEGFDAPGETLKGVIIPKLPFARPTDPLYCERAAREERAWAKYVLPHAVLETKQAAGRLIRKADDRGVLILADSRLVSKNYGATFLNSLQSRTIRKCTCNEIIRALAVMARL